MLSPGGIGIEKWIRLHMDELLPITKKELRGKKKMAETYQ